MNMSGPAAIPKQAYVIWGAIFASVFIYAGIAAYLRMTGFAEGQDAPVDMLIPVLGVMAFSIAGFTLVGVPRILGGANIMVFVILRAALAESIGVFGLVLTILGAPLFVGMIFFAASAVLLLIVVPRARALPETHSPTQSAAYAKTYEQDESARPIEPN